MRCMHSIIHYNYFYQLIWLSSYVLVTSAMQSQGYVTCNCEELQLSIEMFPYIFHLVKHLF